MRQFLILLMVCAAILAACTKPVEEMVASRMQASVSDNQIVVDFTKFPARSIVTFQKTDYSVSYKFDSDSAAYFIHGIVDGDYIARWQIIGVKEDGRYKAKMLNQNQGTVADWKIATILINSHKLSGTYVFTRETR